MPKLRLVEISPKVCKKVNPCRLAALHTVWFVSSSCCCCSRLQHLLAEFSLYRSATPYLLKAAIYVFPFILSSLISLSLPHSLCPSRPICYLSAGSVLRCTAVGLVRNQAGWVTHSQSAALKSCRRQPHPRSPLLSTGTHGWTSIHAHTHACRLLEGRKCRKCLYVNTHTKN